MYTDVRFSDAVRALVQHLSILLPLIDVWQLYLFQSIEVCYPNKNIICRFTCVKYFKQYMQRGKDGEK